MKILKSTIKKGLNRLGYNLAKIKPNKKMDKETNTMSSALERLKNLGIDPKCIVDVGAAKGSWTKLAIQNWPEATYELIEPLIEQKNNLSTLRSMYTNVNYYQAVAGEMPGHIPFSVSNDLDGSGVYGEGSDNIRHVQVITVDEICKEKSGPFMIKLDTHGYEIPILKGAKEALSNTDALVIEVYGFYVSPTGKLFHELSVFLYELGFRLVDIVDIMRRPKDKAFWQADAFYLKEANPIFEENSYK